MAKHTDFKKFCPSKTGDVTVHNYAIVAFEYVIFTILGAIFKIIYGLKTQESLLIWYPARYCVIFTKNP